MAVGSVFRVRSVWTGLPGGPALTTTYFDADTGTADIAAAAMRRFWVSMAPAVTSGAGVTIDDEVVTVSTISGNIIGSAGVVSAAVPTSGAGDPLSRGTQGLLNLNTGVYMSGRQVKGKIYVPNPMESLNTNGVPTASYVTALDTAYAQLKSDPAGVPVVYSPTNGQWFPISSVTPSPYWARIRSRQR